MELNQTTRRTAQETLLSPEEMQTIIDSIPGGLHRHQQFGPQRIDFISGGFAEILGFSSEEIQERLDHHYEALILPEDQAHVNQVLSSLLTLPGHRLAEYRMIRKDGSICRVSDNLRSTRLSDGTLCVFGVATDVTHQYETYAHLKQLTDALPGGFAIYEISSSEIQTLYFSDGICDLMGCTRNEYVELTTQGPQEIIFAADWPTLEDKINNLLDGACAIDCSYRIHTKDGGFRWLNSFGTVTQRQGDRVKINVVVLDITQLRESEEKLRISNEETRVAMAQMGKMICRYDFFTDTLTMPQVYAQKYGFGETIVSLKEHNPQDVLAPQMQETFTSFYQSLLNGDPSGSVDLYAQTVDGEWCWEHVEFVNIFDTQGLPLKAILSTEDITEEKKRESEQELIRENQELFQIVASHSDRHIVKLDIPQRTAYTQPHTAEVFGVDTIIPNMPDTLLQLGHISEESVNSYMNFYHRLISGEPRVQENLKIKRAKSSDWGWYRFDGTVISDDQHHPLSAVISFEDITDRYEKDIAYARLNTKMQKIPEETMLYYEVDLTRMVIEREEGSMLDALRLPSDQNLREMSTGAIEEFVHPQDRAAFSHFIGRDHLLASFAEGNTSLEFEYRRLAKDGVPLWTRVSVELLSDPYTGNVRSFITYLDIDEEKNDALSLLENSQSGISTGLYNKATTERLVKEFLEKSNKNSAILILADMDNLKSINDNLGHGEGDRAIKAFADTLKEHFRPSDIIGRVGGDEFMIFLTDPISDTKLHGVIQALIRKITALRIGENDQISISGSFGVVRSTTNQASFKQLYQQADTALYQVKRNGKSDYAFYTPKMENDNYRYQRHGVLSLNRPEWLDAGELNLLLNAISSYFPIVVSVNLTQNSYYMMQYRHAEVKTIPEFGRFEELIDVVGQTFHPEDRASFLQDFSKENLLSAYRRGENHVRHEGRQREESLAYLWMKTELIFSPNNGSGDLLAVVIARPIEQERTERLKSLQLQKLLDLTAVSSFEYICLVHLEDRSFELFANDGQNTHSVPELGNFDLATQRIRDLHISQEEKEAYYAKANIETIIRRMKETGGHYRYRYVLEEGEREAEFFYYEPTHQELLMTVRHIYPT